MLRVDLPRTKTDGRLSTPYRTHQQKCKQNIFVGRGLFTEIIAPDTVECLFRTTVELQGALETQNALDKTRGIDCVGQEHGGGGSEAGSGEAGQLVHLSGNQNGVLSVARIAS